MLSFCACCVAAEGTPAFDGIFSSAEQGERERPQLESRMTSISRRIEGEDSRTISLREVPQQAFAKIHPVKDVLEIRKALQTSSM